MSLEAMEGNPEQSIANPCESSSIELQSMAMHGGSFPYFTDQLLFSMMTSSSAAHPQLSASYQGNGGGGGGIPEAIDGSSIAQTGNGLNPNTGEPAARRKRGRPRKYGPDGPVLAPSQSYALSLSTSGMNNAPKRRGRPLGSSKKQQMVAQGTSGLESCIHLIGVKEGEDVYAKISSFSQLGSQTICILSATGAASQVTLFKHFLSACRVVAYKGCLEILSMSGSFHNTSDQQSPIGGLSVSIADAEGHVTGGRIAGPFIAASPVLVVLGSFIPSRLELKETNAIEVGPSLNLVSSGRITDNGNSSSRAAFSVSSGDPRNPPIQSTATCSNINSLDHTDLSWKYI